MEITLEMVDQVRERTGCTYEEAKIALEGSNGNVVDAIIAIEKENSINIDVNEKINGLVENIKAAVQKGNANRIRVMRNDEELANIPVNAGIAGGVLGILAGPAVLISTAIVGAVAKFGFNCRFELVKEDGTVVEILDCDGETEEAAETEEAKEPETAEEAKEPEAAKEAEKAKESEQTESDKK
ncbi:MAG: DUF4342 domain-containing protein [Deltaproteobacteria bacterium]|nr:DUF4342 domain-containing protein [Deltaproteobacteria bacterium]